jgi:peptidoglycan/xylan/chitin deacetylase (PgdA/CDA1 family)
VQTVLLWLFYFFTIYAFIPALFSRMFGFRVIKRGISHTNICLTFDDGPDPVYTPRLLDLLRIYNVKATFFIVGKHAEDHLDIVRRLYREGHSIGIHNYLHRSNWIMHPKTVSKHIRDTSAIIEQITGERPQFYRPPWGIMNVFDYASRTDLQIVLWSMMAIDWKKSQRAAKIRKRMLDKLRGGEIYLLHDCGSTFGADPQAPANMIEALEGFIPEAMDRGYSFVRVDEMVEEMSRMAPQHISLPKRMIVSLWLLWEQCFHWLFRLQPAGLGSKDSFLHFRLSEYGGQTLALGDGIRLEKGDRVIELHMNNALLYEYGRKARSPVQLAIQLIRAMEQTMPQLSRIVLARDDAHSIKAILGTTMVHRGVEKFGFVVAELPQSWFSFLAKWYLKLLLSVIHPHGTERLTERKELLVPKQIAISMQEISRRYGALVDNKDALTS